MKDLSTRQFMTIGMIVFLIISIANLLYFLLIFQSLHLYQIVSQLAGIFFNFVLAYMFSVWKKQQPEDNGYKEPDDINEILETFKKDSPRKNRRSNRKEVSNSIC